MDSSKHCVSLKCGRRGKTHTHTHTSDNFPFVSFIGPREVIERRDLWRWRRENEEVWKFQDDLLTRRWGVVYIEGNFWHFFTLPPVNESFENVFTFRHRRDSSPRKQLAWIASDTFSSSTRTGLLAVEHFSFLSNKLENPCQSRWLSMIVIRD